MVGNQLQSYRESCNYKTEYITLLKSKKNTREHQWHIGNGVGLSVMTNPNNNDQVG